MPTAKKDPSTRARRNTASTAAALSEATVAAPKLPKRPRVFDDEGDLVADDWHPETLAWWEDLWSAPMASEYHSSDRHALFLLAVLMDDFWLNPSTKLASEIRLQRQAFGLTPYDRRRLEWTIESAEESKDRGRQRKTSAPRGTVQPAPAADPRSVLRAVN